MSGLPTLVQAWTAARRTLEAAGVDTPVIDARILLLAATGLDRTALITDPHRPLSAEAAARFEGFVARRAAREPAAHIVGRKGFWTLDLLSDRRGLVPRPETETLVDVVLRSEPADAPRRVLDMGTGSGAILLALLAERPAWSGLGVDASADALALAGENAALHALGARASFRQGHWGEGIEETFDIVVSNPPYIESRLVAGLDPEVRDHDPHLALDGGADGLDAYRAILADLARLMKPGGLYAFEIGHDQGTRVPALIVATPLLGAGTLIRDLSDRDRVVVGRRM
jgi:release factor glutamine methyltransferase